MCVCFCFVFVCVVLGLFVCVLFFVVVLELFVCCFCCFGGRCVYRSPCKSDTAPTVSIVIDFMTKTESDALGKPGKFSH